MQLATGYVDFNARKRSVHNDAPTQIAIRAGVKCQLPFPFATVRHRDAQIQPYRIFISLT